VRNPANQILTAATVTPRHSFIGYILLAALFIMAPAEVYGAVLTDSNPLTQQVPVSSVPFEVMEEHNDHETDETIASEFICLLTPVHGKRGVTGQHDLIRVITSPPPERGSSHI
jgi:hypothetical protein